MDKIIIEGGVPLNGKVKVSGAKNAALPLLFASLLADGKHIFTNVPQLQDINSTLDLLKTLGVESERKEHQVSLETSAPKNFEAHYELVRKMRAGVLCLGPLLARHGHARVSLPGGCAIGARPINLHLDALKKMGANISIEGGYVNAQCSKLKGAHLSFDTVTVTGTENLMMAAALADGTTVISNAAMEPEVVNLADYLNALGAKVQGAGTSVIQVQGQTRLRPATSPFEIMPDRIEAGTLVIAGAIAGGEIDVEGFDSEIIAALLSKLKEAQISITELTEKKGVKIKSDGSCKAVDMTTEPYPGFATDLQAQFMALMSFASGTSVIRETIFENRFMHVQELLRMGADIQLKNQMAIIKGKPKGMTGAPVMATDLRASASLVLAGLGASGETTISRIYHLDRGYEKLEEKLKSMGAKTRRVL